MQIRPAAQESRATLRMSASRTIRPAWGCPKCIAPPLQTPARLGSSGRNIRSAMRCRGWRRFRMESNYFALQIGPAALESRATSCASAKPAISPLILPGVETPGESGGSYFGRAMRRSFPVISRGLDMPRMPSTVGEMSRSEPPVRRENPLSSPVATINGTGLVV